MIIDGPPILTGDGFYNGEAINGFGKSFKKLGKKVSKFTKKTTKVLKKAAPIALQLGAAYMTGGASMALTSGMQFLNPGGGGSTGDYMDQVAMASGGGFGGMLGSGQTNAAVDWGGLASRGLDYLRSGDSGGGYSFGGALGALRGGRGGASFGADDPGSGGASQGAAGGTSNYLPIIGVVAAAGLLLLVMRK